MPREDCSCKSSLLRLQIRCCCKTCSINVMPPLMVQLRTLAMLPGASSRHPAEREMGGSVGLLQARWSARASASISILPGTGALSLAPLETFFKSCLLTSYWQSLIVAQFDTIHAHAVTYSQRHCLSLSIIRLGVRARIGIGAVSVD